MIKFINSDINSELEKKGVARVDLEKKLNDVGFDFEKWNKYNRSSRRYRLINNFYRSG